MLKFAACMSALISPIAVALCGVNVGEICPAQDAIVLFQWLRFKHVLTFLHSGMQ